MSSRKKIFGCGHKGLGQYCHRCDQASKLEESLESGNFKKKLPVESGELNGVEKAAFRYSVVKLTKEMRKKLRSQIDHLKGGKKRY